MTTIGNRIKTLRGDTPREAYAPMAGVSKNTIANYESDKRLPDHGFLSKLLEIHPEINPTWLMTGEEPRAKVNKTQPGSRHEEMPQTIKVDENGQTVIPQWDNPDHEMFDYIPLAEAKLSAGGGSFVLSEDIEGYYAFRKSWLNAVTTSSKNLVLMRVTGDSMFPTIQSRDTVLIDTGRKHIKEGEIYALRVDHTVMIKRLSYRLDGKIMIISDNKKEFEAFEADIKSLHVLGQVIFFSRALIPE